MFSISLQERWYFFLGCKHMHVHRCSSLLSLRKTRAKKEIAWKNLLLRCVYVNTARWRNNTFTPGRLWAFQPRFRCAFVHHVAPVSFLILSSVPALWCLLTLLPIVFSFCHDCRWVHQCLEVIQVNPIFAKSPLAMPFVYNLFQQISYYSKKYYIISHFLLDSLAENICIMSWPRNT